MIIFLMKGIGGGSSSGLLQKVIITKGDVGKPLLSLDLLV